MNNLCKESHLVVQTLQSEMNTLTSSADQSSPIDRHQPAVSPFGLQQLCLLLLDCFLHPDIFGRHLVRIKEVCHWCSVDIRVWTRNCISIWSESIWFTAGQSLLGLLPGLAANQLTIGKQSLLHSGRQFYSSDPYFPQSINSVQSWWPPHTKKEIVDLVSRFIVWFLSAAHRICK